MSELYDLDPLFPNLPIHRRPPASAPRRCAAQKSRSAPGTERKNGAAKQRRPTSVRREFRAWRASLRTPLERDTLLMPDAIAESVVREAERYLKAELPAGYSERLAAKAHRC